MDPPLDFLFRQPEPIAKILCIPLVIAVRDPKYAPVQSVRHRPQRQLARHAERRPEGAVAESRDVAIAAIPVRVLGKPWLQLRKEVRFDAVGAGFENKRWAGNSKYVEPESGIHEVHFRAVALLGLKTEPQHPLPYPKAHLKFALQIRSVNNANIASIPALSQPFHNDRMALLVVNTSQQFRKVVLAKTRPLCKPPSKKGVLANIQHLTYLPCASRHTNGVVDLVKAGIPPCKPLFKLPERTEAHVPLSYTLTLGGSNRTYSPQHNVKEHNAILSPSRKQKTLPGRDWAFFKTYQTQPIPSYKGRLW